MRYTVIVSHALFSIARLTYISSLNNLLAYTSVEYLTLPVNILTQLTKTGPTSNQLRDLQRPITANKDVHAACINMPTLNIFPQLF